MRFRDAALVAAWLATLPAMAGTPVANSGGMEIAVPNLVPIPVAEPTPAAGASEALPASASAAAAEDVPASITAGSLFETLIADFRHGEPEMGAVPHLPVPPPHRMRAEDAPEDGENQPLDGNGGNALPLHLVSLPLSTDPSHAAATARSQPAALSLRGVEGQIFAPTGDWRREVPNAGSAQPAAARAPAIQVPAAPASGVPTQSAEAQTAFNQIERQVKEFGTAARPDVPRPTTSDRATFSSLPTPAQPDSSGAKESDLSASAGRLPAAPAAVATSTALQSNQPGSAPHASSVARDLSHAASRMTAASRNSHVASRMAAASRMADGVREAAVDVATGAPAANLETRLAAQPVADRSAPFEWLQQNAHREGRVVTESVAAGDPSQVFTMPPAPSGNAVASAATLRADAPVLQLPAPIATPEWADGLGERVVWLTSQSLDNAHIRLNPAHLGPVEVRVSVADDQASVAFVAQHAVTREALESAAPRLREMLQAQGFTNVNVEIGQHAQHSSGQRAHDERGHYSAAAASVTDELPEVRAYQPQGPATSRSILDTFA